MPTTYPDGAVEYSHPDVFADILFNGESVMAYHPISAKVWPNGYGYVFLNVNPATMEPHTWIDGQEQNFWMYGYVQVITE